MTPEQALNTIWAVAMEASVPLKNYQPLIHARMILEQAIKKEAEERPKKK